jgi:hypothetical protein
MHVSVRQLQPYLRRIIKGWHPALRRSFRQYFFSTSLTSRRLRMNQACNLPYWLVIPQWLAKLFLGKQRTNQRFLFDVLCGQFCMFLAVKIHDDVFDGQAQDRSLLFAADHLLLSARQAFAPYFSSKSLFWSFFDSSLRQTVNAIIAVDQSQLHGYGSPSSVAALARQGYAACNIAAYAICLRAKRIRLFQRIARCTGELAFVGQLLDDLEDMMVDFQRGRVNYAAYFLLGPSIDRRKNFVGRLTRSIILNGSADRFFDMLQGHLQRACEIADTTAVPMLVDYVGNYRIELKSMETQLHRKRVQVLFESALSRRR